jgi:hypothetical protein
MRPPKYIAQIDSASTLVRALGQYLQGKDLPGMGLYPDNESMAIATNALPRSLRQYLYIAGGRKEALRQDQMDEVTTRGISQWVVDEYPKRKYPAVMIGSANGAMMQLCAALGIPWLSQTVLTPIRRKKRLSADDIKADIEEMKGPAREILKNNPELQVNHMHDPIQDRLMVQQMGYFRIKQLQLGPVYEQFLTDSLPRGATVFVVDCRLSWPTSKIGDRHFFQLGGFGEVTPQEYLKGSPEVDQFLKKRKASVKAWQNIPKPDAERPEAEWGLEPALLDDVRRLAKKRGWKVRRIVFRDPEDMSPLVADFYREWYAKRRIPVTRMLAQSFILVEPWWTIRTGSIPFWLTFNTKCSAQRLHQYLAAHPPLDELYMTVFCNGVKGVGQATIKDWNELLGQANKTGKLLGIDAGRYPSDLGVYFRYHGEIKKIPARYRMPEPVPLAQLDKFLDRESSRYRVRWLE